MNDTYTCISSYIIIVRFKGVYVFFLILIITGKSTNPPKNVLLLLEHDPVYTIGLYFNSTISCIMSLFKSNILDNKSICISLKRH